MLRRDIIKGIKNVINSVHDKNMEMLFHVPEKIPPEAGLETFRRFLLQFEKFGVIEKRIIEIYQLEFLVDIKFWSMLFDIRNEQPNRKEYTYQLRRLQFAQDTLNKWLSFLEQESIPKSITNKKKDTLEQLTVITIEENQLSTPSRLILVLESIQGFYTVSAELLGLDLNSISILSCDSGSDKSFDFLGLAKVMEMVKEIIITFWNKFIFYHEDKSGRHLELIAESLPIIEKISKMKEQGSIGPERAELLRRQTIDCVLKFSKSGSTIPEIEKYTLINPRQLMKPEPKLLVAHYDLNDSNNIQSTSKIKKVLSRNKKKKADDDKII